MWKKLPCCALIALLALPCIAAQSTNYLALSRFAKDHGFTVTSTAGDKHNKGSKHYLGRAIDVRTKNKSARQIKAFIEECQMEGIRVIDERKKPKKGVWSGPHLHLEL